VTARAFIVDVFAQARYTGNQLAVVIAGGMSAEEMQAIAAEMNFSETTFVAPSPEADGGYRVRMFTPAREVSFAGHPILGTAYLVRQRLAAAATDLVRLNLAVGQIAVSFDGETPWFRAPAMTLGRACEAGRIASSLNLSQGDIDDRSPVQEVSAGTAAILVPLRTLDALRRARLDLAAHQPLADAGFPKLVYLFCRETRDPANQLSARFFFEAHGVREDPATGNGAAFLGHYMLAHGVMGTPPLSLRIEQGHEVGRPSLIFLRAAADGEVLVGGNVVPVLEGAFS
jgi:trans-2,3-dihydro-3-hydroxyanthranilate isomerase